MRGPPDELRCASCAQKSYAMFEEPRVRISKPLPPFVTGSVVALAVIGTLVYWTWPEEVAFAVADPHVWDGEVWRFVTAVFLHKGWLHLLFNCYWTWQFGRTVEGWMGPLAYAGFFLLTAVGSSAAEFLAMGQGGVGLSGVGYALFGLLYALRRHKDFAAAQMQPQIVQLFVFWFFLCIALTYTHILAVGNVAHGAGCILGWLVGQALLLRRPAVGLAGVTVLVVVVSAACMYMPWNGGYATHAGFKCLTKGDEAGALYWFEKAERADPDDPIAPAMVKILRTLREGRQSGEKDGAKSVPADERLREPADEGD
jgi:membrane associated rhomboid family serine protease